MRVGNLVLTPFALQRLTGEQRVRLDERAQALGCSVGVLFGRDRWRAGASGPAGRTPSVFASNVALALGVALDEYAALVQSNYRIGLMADEADRFDPDELWTIYQQSNGGDA